MPRNYGGTEVHEHLDRLERVAEDLTDALAIAQRALARVHSELADARSRAAGQAELPLDASAAETVSPGGRPGTRPGAHLDAATRQVASPAPSAPLADTSRPQDPGAPASRLQDPGPLSTPPHGSGPEGAVMAPRAYPDARITRMGLLGMLDGLDDALELGNARDAHAASRALRRALQDLSL